MGKYKRLLAKVLVVAMVMSIILPFTSENVAEGARKKPKFSVTKMTIKVKQTKTLYVKNVKKAKLTWKSSKKKYATVKKFGKTKAKIKGLKKGRTTVTCRVKVGKRSYNLKCIVNVKKVVAPTKKPSSMPTVSPSPSPSPTIAPQETPNYASASLKEYYGDIFENVGNCLSYNTNGMKQLTDAATMAHVNKHYNSFTLENEMKPNAILVGSWNAGTTITREEAVERGYVLPEGYTESVVPSLNFSTMDNVLKVAYDNGLRMRAHTLVWHSQSPEWFFRTNYAGTTDVSKTVMDARMEFYIRTVMKHIYESDYAIGKDGKPIVYSWDVVNEYLNNNGTGTGWVRIYGNTKDDQTPQPDFVKKAFTIAKDVLNGYALKGGTWANDVTLFYNDFNTYINADKIVNMINYINDNGKVCDGVGMQAHLDVDYPSISFIGQAIDKFKAAGFEIQITELDVTINNESGDYKQEYQTEENQTPYVKNLMEMLIQKKKDGANITGLTWWGLYDDISWRGGKQRGGPSDPLLFSTGINAPKPSFYATIDAAFYNW